MKEGLETNAEQKFKRTYGDKKYNTRTINLKSEQRELEGERQKDMDFHFSFFICCGNDPS